MTTKCNLANELSCVVFSPLPLQIAVPPFTKNGTSLPNSAANSKIRGLGTGEPKSRLIASKVPAALPDAPPSPATDGIKL